MFDQSAPDFLDEAIKQTFESRNSVLGEKLCQETVLIEWVDLDESISGGDYSPEDKTDVSVLGFVVSIWDNTDGWIENPDSSFVTQVPVDTDKNLLQRGLEILMSEYQPLIKAGYPINRLGQQFRLLSVDDLKKNEK